MEDIKLSGKFKLVIGDQIIEFSNTIMTVGKNALANQLINNVDNVFKYIALGDSDTAVNVSQTTLNSELGRLAVLTQTVLNNVITVTGVLQYNYLGGYTLREIGIFGVGATDTVNTGTMLCRALISPAIVKTESNVINITYTLTIG